MSAERAALRALADAVRAMDGVLYEWWAEDTNDANVVACRDCNARKRWGPSNDCTHEPVCTVGAVLDALAKVGT